MIFVVLFYDLFSGNKEKLYQKYGFGYVYQEIISQTDPERFLAPLSQLTVTYVLSS